MVGPPSSPPLHLSWQQESKLKTRLLPAFSHEGFNTFKPRQFVKHKVDIYRDDSPSLNSGSAFLPTPFPTSEANLQASSPPPSSPQIGVNGTVDAPDLAFTAAELNETKVNTPLQQMLIIRLPYTGEKVTVGRSSKSSDFAVRSSNRLASRIHANLHYDSRKNILMIECLGWNGLVVSVSQLDGTKTSHEVKRGSILNVEGSEGISLDIHGDKAIIEIANDANMSDVTEDEVWMLSNKGSPDASPLKRKRLDEGIDQLDIPKSICKDGATDSPVEQVASRLSTPEVQKSSENLLLSLSPNMPDKSQECEVDQKETGLDKVHIGTESPKAKTPEPQLSTDSFSGIRKIRRQREHISDLPVQELSNVIVNYIAFSRLSAVPLAAVHKANSMLQSLTKSHAREIIQSIECVGVIEGVVDDTTGRRNDDEYYYIPEKDEDIKRRNAVQQTKGHRSLRNCRKTKRQYYYRPLQLE